jgi:hypothetical protein
LKKCETTKLFWDKYPYKLALRNRIGSIFRDKNLSHARSVLDNMQRDYEAGDPIKLERYKRCDFVSESHFLDARRLYKFLSKRNDYTLRIEGVSVSIYALDREWLHTVKSAMHKENLIEFWEPAGSSILEANTILVKEPFPYKLKVTLGTGSMSTAGFANFAKTNPKQIRLGPVLLQELEQDGYVNGMYFYARDERTLQLCNLMLDCIRRIDKIVAKQSLDK